MKGIHGSADRGGLTSLWLFQRTEKSSGRGRGRGREGERGEDPGGLSLSVTLENYEAAFSLSREGHGEGGQVDGIRLQVAAAQNSPPAAKS